MRWCYILSGPAVLACQRYHQHHPPLESFSVNLQSLFEKSTKYTKKKVSWKKVGRGGGGGGGQQEEAD